MNTFKLILALPAVILLAYISLRLTNKYLYRRNQGRSIQILERVPLNNKNSLCVIKMGEEYMVASVTENAFQVVKTLEPKEVETYRIEPQETNFTQNLKFNLKKFIKEKLRHE